jgi:predicted pyridoxine 5'-phosphate oxidase superfamily flavin-nucleotide-binding protein
MHREVRTADELRTIVGHPTEFVVNNVTDRLAPVHKEWLAHSPLGFVATTDARGRVDVSPQGDPKGFVQVLDCHQAFTRPEERVNIRTAPRVRISITKAEPRKPG